MTARILNVTEAEYFADTAGAVPSLSQSIARTLVTKSPAHAWVEHPRLGGQPSEPTKATDQGEIIHRLLLGRGAEVEVLPFDNYRKKAAQEARDAAREAGRTPMLEREYEGILAASTAIVRSLAALGVVLEGESEVAIEWEEAGQHGPVLCRGKLDHLKIGAKATIYDVKKIESADPRSCSNNAYSYGMDIQGAAYTSGVEKLYPEFAGRVEYIPIFVEIAQPYAVVPGPLDAVLQESGRRRWARAINLWESCLRADRWPSYVDAMTVIEAPGWLIAQMEREADL
jgi:hypothetical protein